MADASSSSSAMKRLLPAWMLCGPALLLYLVMLAVPLVLTAILTLNAFDWNVGILDTYTVANWVAVVTDPYYLAIFARTLYLAFLVTLIAIVIGVPEAYILSRMKKPWNSIFLIIVLGPLLISVVVRTLGWTLLIGSSGVLNAALKDMGLIDQPFQLMYTMTGMTIAMVHVLVPFMVISVWASLHRLDPTVEQAALSLGASSWTAWRRVVLPQIMPGVLSGSIIVFALTASAFATPSIIGGRRLKVAATAAYDEFLSSLNWPLGATIAVILLLANVIIMVCANRMIERKYAKVFE